MKRANRTAPNPPREEAPRPEMPWARCYCAGAGPRLTALTATMCQGPIFDHFRQAGLEMLLGLRAILDAQIDALTRQEKKGTKVTVE